MKCVGSVSLNLFFAPRYPARFVVVSMCVCECDQITKTGIVLISSVFVQAVDIRPTVESSPRALACGEVVVVPGLRVGEGASLSLGVVVAGADRPVELPWANLCRLDIFSGLTSHRG